MAGEPEDTSASGTAAQRFPESDRDGVARHLVNIPAYIIIGLIALLGMRPRPAIDHASVGPIEQRRVG